MWKDGGYGGRLAEDGMCGDELGVECDVGGSTTELSGMAVSLGVDW
ncbi:hypothetical protein [Paenibacillus xylanexedens]|nr:hypothetical protein [Paenibacillus xylanexedens]